MRQAPRPWKPPSNMQFFIWPHYRLVIDGVELRLGKRHAQILLLLMAHKDRRFSIREISREIYGDMENGGPLYDNNICVHVSHMKGLFQAAGFALDLKRNGAFQGYAFHDGSITAPPDMPAEVKRQRAKQAALENALEKNARREKAAADKAARVSRKITRAAKKIKEPPKRVEPDPVETYVFEDRFAGSSGWFFPERVEEETWRRRGQ